MTMAKKRNFQHKLYSHLCGVWSMRIIVVRIYHFSSRDFLKSSNSTKMIPSNWNQWKKREETIEWELSHPQNECFLKHRKKYWTPDIIVSLFVDCSCMTSTIPFIHVLVLCFFFIYIFLSPLWLNHYIQQVLARYFCTMHIHIK